MCRWDGTSLRGVVYLSSALLAFLLLAASSHAEPPDLSGKTMDELMAAFKAEPWFWKAADIAEEINRRKDTSVIPQIAPMLETRDRHTRCIVAYMLAALGDERGFPILLAEAGDMSPDREITETQSDGKPYLEGQIRQDRYFAMLVLARLGDKRAAPALIGYLDDPDLDYQAAYALGCVGDVKAIPALKACLARPDDTPMRSLPIAVAHALMKLGDAQGLITVKALQADETAEPVARRNALYGIGEFRMDGVFEVLYRALADECAEVCEAAIKELVTFGDPRAIFHLEKLLSDTRILSGDCESREDPSEPCRVLGKVAADAIESIRNAGKTDP